VSHGILSKGWIAKKGSYLKPRPKSWFLSSAMSFAEEYGYPCARDDSDKNTKCAYDTG
jgi:hypothetical protein